MPTVKIRFANIVKKVRFDPIVWTDLQKYVEQAFNLTLDSHKLMCMKPLQILVLGQNELDQLQSVSLVEIEIFKGEETVYAQVIKDLLEIPTNREIVIRKFVDVMRIYPSTSLDALLPSVLENSIKDKLVGLYREACQRTEKKSAFKLVYVNEGGKQVLRGLPSSQWINYSTTSFDSLNKSLPPNMIEKFNKK